MNGNPKTIVSHMTSYRAFDIVAVPFPFVDSRKAKKRPALVISCDKSFNKKSGHVVLLMITSSLNSRWPLDIEITDLLLTGLKKPSMIRMKTFTLDQKIIDRKIGVLSVSDRKRLKASLNKLLDDVV